MAERRVADRRCVVCKSDADRCRRGGRPALGPALTIEQKAERYDRYLERCRLTEAKRHARKKGQLGQVEWSDVERLLKAQKWKCANCGCSVKKKYHIDHITPLARGGMHDKSNLQILCPYCNISKNDKHPVDWALSMGRLV